MSEQEPIQAYVYTEGHLHEKAKFETQEQMDWYSFGLHDGASAYGAGRVDVIPHSALSDPDWFNDEFADSFYNMTLERVREDVGWTEPERQGKVNFSGKENSANADV